MNRELGFYTMVPGLTIYGSLLAGLAAFVVPQCVHHQLTMDTAIFSLFVTIFLLPLSLALMAYGNSHLKLVSSKVLISGAICPILIAFMAMACAHFI